MTSYRNDLRWLTVKFAANCHKCGRSIGKGEQGFYHPIGRVMYCKECGADKAASFVAEAQDEDWYNRSY